MGTIVPGLCSVTFRRLDTDRIVDLAADAGLGAIEWGADVHVLPGDTTRAEAVARRTTDAGLSCPSYGSYFFAGRSDAAELDALLDTATALGASTVRVWAPGDVAAPEDDAEPTIDALARACERAAARGLRIAVEFHPGTLTETAAGANRLLAAVGPDLRTYWQPRPGAVLADAGPELDAVLPALAHLHVFAWEPDSTRLPLAAQAELWTRVLDTVTRVDDVTRCAYLEFVRGDDPAAFARDAATLRRLLPGAA